MGKLEFCQKLVCLDGKLISFADRPYLPAIYASQARKLVLRCSRQTEKSTFLVNSILFEACTYPGIHMLLVTPRLEQGRTLCRSRLLPCIQQSPFIHRVLAGKQSRQLPVTNIRTPDIGPVLPTFVLVSGIPSRRRK